MNMNINKLFSHVLICVLLIITFSCSEDLPPGGNGNNDPVDLLTDLVVHYQFTGNLLDGSGNGHNGISHSTSLVIDRFGNNNQALELKGSLTSYMEIPHHADLNLNGDFTICFWVNMPTIPTNYSVVLGKGQDITNFYGLILDGTSIGPGGSMQQGLTANFLLTNSTGNFQPCANKGGIHANTWHFIALYQNQAGNKQGLYVDTKFLAETSYFNFQTTNIYPLIVGRHYTLIDGSGGYEYPFKGSFDDLRIYNRTLTDAELTALYEETQ